MATALERFAAPMHMVEVAWRLSNTEAIVIGPKPKLVLGLIALRDIEVKTLHISYPEMRTVQVSADAVFGQTVRVLGKRKLKPEGDNWVSGFENVNGDLPVEAVHEIRWTGSLAKAMVQNTCATPHDYWAYSQRIAVPRHACVGVIVTADKPTICKVKIAGV